jgi:hypothetical protein
MTKVDSVEEARKIKAEVDRRLAEARRKRDSGS